jgi:hypothetical protein
MMKLSEMKMLTEQQTTVAQKILSVVPIREAWSTREVMAELRRLHQTHVTSGDVLEGSLYHLKKVGLVKQINGGWIRAPWKDDKAISQSAGNFEYPQEEPAILEQPNDPLVVLGQAAATLRQLAETIETAALEMAERLNKVGESSKKLEALRGLLKEL